MKCLHGQRREWEICLFLTVRAAAAATHSYGMSACVCVCIYHSGVHFITTELIFNALRHVRLDTLLSIGHYVCVYVCLHCLWRVVLIQKTHAHEYSSFNMVRTEWHRLLCKIRLVHTLEVRLLYNFCFPKTNQSSQPTKIDVKCIFAMDYVEVLPWTKELFNSKIDERNWEHERWGKINKNVTNTGTEHHSVYTFRFASETTARKKCALECNVNEFSF